MARRKRLLNKDYFIQSGTNLVRGLPQEENKHYFTVIETEIKRQTGYPHK